MKKLLVFSCFLFLATQSQLFSQVVTGEEFLSLDIKSKGYYALGALDSTIRSYSLPVQGGIEPTEQQVANAKTMVVSLLYSSDGGNTWGLEPYFLGSIVTKMTDYVQFNQARQKAPAIEAFFACYSDAIAQARELRNKR